MKKNKNKNRKLYIHYGSSILIPEKRTVWSDPVTNKPNGVLWASPVYSDWSWRDYLEAENWRLGTLQSYFKFRLKSGTNILIIKEICDIFPYLIDKNGNAPTDEELRNHDFSLRNIDSNFEIDFNRIYNEFDGMEIYYSSNYREFHNSYLFYAYDCDSIAIWNIDKIIPKGNNFEI